MTNIETSKFVKRARQRFGYEVAIKGGFTFLTITQMFGRDAMPTINPEDDREGRWTVTDQASAGEWRFFFLNATDAVEFKLRFG